MKIAKLSIIIFAACTVFAVCADAGTLIKATVTALDPAAAPGEITMYLEADRARIEFSNDTGRNVVIDFQEDGKPVLYFIDGDSWSARELKQKDVKKARSLADDELYALKESFRGMPRDEREVAKDNMKFSINRLENLAEPREEKKFKVEKRDEGRRVHDWQADEYTGYYDGNVQGRYSVASWDQLGIEYDDVRVLADMRRHFDDIGTDLGYVFLWGSDVQGFPVRIETVEFDSSFDVTEIGEVSKQNFDPDLFALSRAYDRYSFFQSSGGSSGMPSMLNGSATPMSLNPTANPACKKPIHNER